MRAIPGLTRRDCRLLADVAARVRFRREKSWHLLHLDLFQVDGSGIEKPLADLVDMFHQDGQDTCAFFASTGHWFLS